MMGNYHVRCGAGENLETTSKSYLLPYFAPKAHKSMGYTSSYNSRWANGSQSTGFLAVYDVAVGKKYHPVHSDSSLNYAKLQQVCPGAHCTWAIGASCGLLNDEVIVYQDNQSSIKYLIEFAA